MTAPMKYEQAAWPSQAVMDMLADPKWALEQKVDGWRLLTVIEPGRDLDPVFLTHGGAQIKSTAALRVIEQCRIRERLQRLVHHCSIADMRFEIDGELLADGTYWLFDMPYAGIDLAGQKYRSRRNALHHLAETWFADDPVIRQLPSITATQAKQERMLELLDSGAEGVMLKHVDAPYLRGQRTDLALKVKFTKTLDAVVIARDTDGRKNAVLGAWLYGVGVRELVTIGSCSMIGKPDAQPGDVVEVRYLYATPDHQLYQPTLLRIRDDKAAEDCELAQLSYVNRKVLP